MSRILYLECYSGISGDMTVGALLDLGADREVLENALAALELNGYHLHFGRTLKCGIDAFDFDVYLEDSHNHSEDHDHHHLEAHHQHTEGGGHIHSHGHQHLEGEHQPPEEAHHHEHRNIEDIYEIIEKLQTKDSVKSLAKRIFMIVADAEAKAHGIPKEEVHFHEVGAMDSIVDIIGVAVCIENLSVDKVIISPLWEGTGYAKCQHGVIPVPVPATANIAAQYSLKLKMTDNEGEMVTPTGAAIAAALSCGEKLPEHYTIKKIGIGAGKKEFKNANILRAMLIEEDEEHAGGQERRVVEGRGSDENAGQIWQLETNIDDCSGEALGFTLECLCEAGVTDVWYCPIYMKKNRPAYTLRVLCEKEMIEAMEDIIFTHTTTVGIRRFPVERTVLERRVEKVETPYGQAEVKVCEHNGKEYCYPEYESIKKICLAQKKNFKEVYREIVEIFNK